MNTKVDLVIKFGGSSITDKDNLETLNHEALAGASQLIKTCLDNKLTCVVVHGAGSFGHHQAKQYKVSGGWTHHQGDSKDTMENVKWGLCCTRLSCTQLHHHVTNSLMSEKVPAIAISICGLWQTDNGSLTQYNLSPMLNLLQNGFVPVLHGDCVLDTSRGCSIVSGDTIIQTICKDCDVQRVVFLTNVNGVYDKPPQNCPDAKLQRKLYVNKSGQIEKDQVTDGIISDSSSEYDVTGGMTLKLKTAMNIVVESGMKTPVFVCKIGSNCARRVCLSGQVDIVDEEEGTVLVGLLEKLT